MARRRQMFVQDNVAGGDRRRMQRDAFSWSGMWICSVVALLSQNMEFLCSNYTFLETILRHA